MRVQESITYRRGVFCVWVVAVCSARLLSGSSTPGSAPAPHEQFDALANEILSDPNCLHPDYTEKIQDLAEFKGQMREEQRDLLALLVTGLDQCEKGEFETAGKLLREPARSTYVRELAEMVIGDANMPNRIWRDCRARGRSTFCKECRGTGLLCCPICSGVGGLPCANCGGLGKLWPMGRPPSGRGRRRPAVLIYDSCRTCGGDGSIACQNERCRRESVWECECVQQNKRATDFDDLDACGKLISVASYLHAGGVDLYTSDAFERAPGLPLSGSQDAEPDMSGDDPNR